MLRQKEVKELAAAVHRIGVPTYTNGMARGLLGTASSSIQFKHHRYVSLFMELVWCVHVGIYRRGLLVTASTGT